MNHRPLAKLAAFLLHATVLFLPVASLLAAFPQPRTDGKSQGTKSFLVIRFKFSDSVEDPPSQADVSTYMQHAKTWFADVSQGAFTFDWTSTTQVFVSSRAELQISESQYMSEVMPEIRAAAKAKGYAVDSYDFVIYQKPTRRNPMIGDAWAILDGSNMTLGGRHSPPADGSAGVVVHEMCHLIGLGHASFNESASSDPHGPGDELEYGDRDDAMGAQYRGPINAINKYYLGWIGGSSVSNVTANGTYRLFRHDDKQSTGTRMLVVQNPKGEKYYIDYRYKRFEGRNDEASAGIRKANNGRTLLLDAHPQSNEGQIDEYEDYGFRVGEVFNDYQSGIKVKVVAAGGAAPSQFLDVMVTFGDYSLSAPSIFSQPESIKVMKGDVGGVLQVVGLGSKITYQWYEGVSGDRTKPLPGQKESLLLVPPLDASKSYWVELGNAVGKLASNTAYVTIEPSDLPVEWVKRFKIGEGIDSTPANCAAAFSLNGRGYMGVGNALICFDVRSGSEIWRHGDSKYGSFYNPALDGDGRVFAGHWDGSFSAFDASTGRLLWTYDPQNPWMVTRVGCAIAGKLVVFQRGNQVIALNRADGKVAWIKDNPGNVSRPVSDGIRVVWALPSGTSPKIVCVNAASGTSIWEYLAEGDIRASVYDAHSLAISHGKVFAVIAPGSPSVDQLTAIDSITGQAIWKCPASSRNVEHKSPVTDGDGNAYWIASGKLMKIDGKTGGVVWKLGNYTVAMDGNLVMLDPRTLGVLNSRVINGNFDYSFVRFDATTPAVLDEWAVARRKGISRSVASVCPGGSVFFGLGENDSVPAVVYSVRAGSGESAVPSWLGAQGSMTNNGKAQEAYSVVTNVRAAQVPGTHRVRLNYDLFASGPCSVGVNARLDNTGASLLIPANALSGDVTGIEDNGVDPGKGKTIELDASKADALDNIFTRNLRFKVTAEP